MADSPVLTASDAVIPLNHGRHYSLIKKNIPSGLVTADAELRMALRLTKPSAMGWYHTATLAQKSTLKTLLNDRLGVQSRLAKTLKPLQMHDAFARPLLQQALVSAGFVVSVDEVFVHLFTPAFDAFGLRTGGFTSRMLSLLQAAQHNFEQPETEPGYFGRDSGFITRPDALGRYAPYATALTVEGFAALCRQLDIGAKYQEHLQLHLSPQSDLAQGRFEGGYKNQQKAMLHVDAHIALLKGDIDAVSHGLLMRVIKGERQIKTGAQQVWYRYPCVMGLLLKGCVVFDLCVKDQYSDAMIVWIPGDPQQPLKKYASFFDFRDELLRKLTPSASRTRETGLTPYQQFLSQFIAQKDRPYYYRRLTQLWRDAPQLPWGSEWFHSQKTQDWIHVLAPVPSLGLNVEHNPEVHTLRVQAELPSVNIEICTMSADYAWVDVDLWEKQFQDMRERAFSNARNMALPTADADANNRSARLSHYLNMGLFAANLVGMAVPLLGELMMAVMAGQLLYETIEGIEEWSDGDTESAWTHVCDVLENLATLAVGGLVAQGVVAPVIEKLKVISLPGGKQRLWQGDIDTYAHPIRLEPGSQPDASGLHTVSERVVLPYDGKNFVLNKDPVSGKYRAQHPTRPDAYQPEFRHNGQGVWVHEGEDPLTWERSTLLRRLGPSVEGLSDPDLESILTISNVPEDVLRRMYVENEPTPIMLVESIRQFRAYAQVESAISQVNAGPMSAEVCTFAPAFSVEMQGWPTDKAILVFDLTTPSEPSFVQYGNAQASDVTTISRAQLMRGELAERVIDSMSVQQLEGLFGERHVPVREERVKLFKEKLSKHMADNTQRLFDSLYDEPLMDGDPARALIEQLQRVFTSLPKSIARRMVMQASKAELDVMMAGRIPDRLSNTARWLQGEARLSLAYLGLYRDTMVTPDTEALALNSLEYLPGWTNDLRLEVRNDGMAGELRASFGARDASHRKVLVRLSDGKYKALNEEGAQLHAEDDFYRSLHHALTDSHRRSMGLPHVGQGHELKLKIQQFALPRDKLRLLLRGTGRGSDYYQRSKMPINGSFGYGLSGRGAVGAFSANETYRVRLKNLFPNMTPEDISHFFGRYGGRTGDKIIGFEQEFQGLKSVLDQWVYAPIDGVAIEGYPTDAQRPTLVGRIHIADRLQQAWRRTGSLHLDSTNRYVGQKMVFEGSRLGPILESLPPLMADFGHVTQIELIQLEVTDAIDGFLSHFPKLRSLNLNENALTRLPNAVGVMSRLEELFLTDTAITLTPESVSQLKGLTRMKFMMFDDSPLGLAPDVSRMPQLHTLSLNGCGLGHWPEGLLDLARPRDFLLSLADNPLTEIPNVEPGSPSAEILARTALSQSHVSETAYARYNEYRVSAGIDIDRQSPPGLEMSSRYWLAGSEIPAQELTDLKALWNRVETSIGSEPLFNILGDQAENLKNRTTAFRADITSKVWRMLRAIDENPELRDKIFQMASAPFTCVDAGAQVFNALGVEVSVYEVYGIPETDLRQTRMLKLARGKARLDELGRIARARVAELEALGRHHPEYDEDGHLVQHHDDQGRLLENIDEVEIYLRYTTTLAERLDLPWQSPDMMFMAPDVTAEMIESAFDHVMALEAGDGIVTQLLEQPLWVTFLEDTFQSSLENVQAKMDALSDLQVAQEAWVEQGHLSVEQKMALRTQIEKAAVFLKIPARDVAPGKIMSSADYDAHLQRLYETRQTYLEIMTKKILAESTKKL